MEMQEVKAFNSELSGLYENKPPISKAKMSAITRGAIKAIKFYKHVVHSVEKFIQKCKPEYKVPGLYVIDSIVRQSRHQFGQDKDVFAPRFAKNMQQTFANLFRCPPEDKRNIIRVLNLWQKNNVFSSEVIQPLLDMADPNHPLHQEIQQQQHNTSNGSTLNVSHMSENKISPGMHSQHTPHVSTPMGDQFQDQPSGPPSSVKFNRKLLNDFEYDSEDEPPAPSPLPPSHQTHNQHQHTTYGSQHTGPSQAPAQPLQSQHLQNPAEALGSILTNPEIMRQLQSLQAQMQMMTGMQIPNLMPMMSDMQQMQQNQSQTAPFIPSQPEPKKLNESKEDGANESDIEFVDAGPQVIEIPDANDSRSPSPRHRRHGSRSRSPRKRRRSRSRSHSRRRDREREREREKEKSYKEKEAEREKQREREKKGLPPIKKENLSVCSTTLWVGHLSKLTTPEELWALFGAVGGVVSIDVVAPRGCAFVVMERRRDAARARDKLDKHKLHSKEICVAWAPGKGVKGREWKDYWEADLGVSYLPWNALHERWLLGILSLDALEEGGSVDEDTLPKWLPPRIIPKTGMDNMPGVPPASVQGMMHNMPPNMSNMPPNMSNMPPNMNNNMPPNMGGNMPPNMGSNMPPNMGGNMPPNMPPNMTGNIPQNVPANMNNITPNSIPMPVPGMPPPPGMPGGLPPSLAGLRPPVNIPGLQNDGSMPPRPPLMGFPPGMPPQPGMMGSLFGGLLGMGGSMGMVGGMPLLRGPMPTLPHMTVPTSVAVSVASSQNPPPAISSEKSSQQTSGDMTAMDDAMELDNEEQRDEENVGGDVTEEDQGNHPTNMLPDQIQAMFSKPPPNFSALEPPPEFQHAEHPPKEEEQRKQDKDRERDRDRDKRERGEKDRRDDRRDRDKRDDRRERDRKDRDRVRDRDRDRDDRRDRDRERGRDRRDRSERGDKDRERDRGDRSERERDRSERERDRGDRGDRERFNAKDNSERTGRSRDRSPRNVSTTGTNEAAEKTLQDRLWEMANGRPRDQCVPTTHDSERHVPEAEGAEQERRSSERSENEERTERDDNQQPPPPIDPEHEEQEENNTGGWRAVPPRPPLPHPHQGPPPGFRPEMRMGGPPRLPMRGPWMEIPGGGPPPIAFFNGMGPPPFNRPPFDRPPFDGPRPPFNRLHFEGMMRPPFDGPPPFNGPRAPFEGPPPRFDGPRPPFEGPRISFDGPRPRPPFDSLRLSFDGPRLPFDGPRPPFVGHRPPFDGLRVPFNERQFEGEHNFDGPPRFENNYDRTNRRFDEREEREWNNDRNREWDNRTEWEDKRRDRRSKDNEDWIRDKNDRRRNMDERDRNSGERSHTEEKSSKKERDRKSRWGDADDTGSTTEKDINIEKANDFENIEQNENVSEVSNVDNTADTIVHSQIGEELQYAGSQILNTTSQVDESNKINSKADNIESEDYQAKLLLNENVHNETCLGVENMESENSVSVQKIDEHMDNQDLDLMEGESFEAILEVNDKKDFNINIADNDYDNDQQEKEENKERMNNIDDIIKRAAALYDESDAIDTSFIPMDNVTPEQTSDRKESTFTEENLHVDDMFSQDTKNPEVEKESINQVNEECRDGTSSVENKDNLEAV